MTDVVLECRDLSKEYSVGPQTLRVLDEVQLRLLRGERVAIVGSSGSGKTTLLNMLGGLDTPTSGEVGISRVRRLMAPPMVLGPKRTAAGPLNTSTPTIRVGNGK